MDDFDVPWIKSGTLIPNAVAQLIETNRYRRQPWTLLVSMYGEVPLLLRAEDLLTEARSNPSATVDDVEPLSIGFMLPPDLEAPSTSANIEAIDRALEREAVPFGVFPPSGPTVHLVARQEFLQRFDGRRVCRCRRGHMSFENERREDGRCPKCDAFAV